jgi:hypothetical protein
VATHCDQIKLLISSAVTELRFLVVDKVRIRHLRIENKNVFSKHNGCLVVVVHGQVLNLLSIVAKGACMVVWNQDHVLNTSLGNCLTIKTRASCELLYMLTICTQLREINVKKIIVVTRSGALDAAMKSLNLWHNQYYVEVNREYHVVLRKIHDIIHELKFDVTIKDPGDNEAIHAIYDNDSTPLLSKQQRTKC